MKSDPSVKFCSGVGNVTGANFLLQHNDIQILIDCGLIQGERVASEENKKAFPYNPSGIHALCITHAHLDHVGRIPKLVKEGFRGVIYSTAQTRALAELVLNDAVNILNAEANQEGYEPLYDSTDVQAVFPLWQTLDYHQELEIANGVSIYLKDAGHILGSSMIEVRISNDKNNYNVQLPTIQQPINDKKDTKNTIKIVFT